MERLLSEAIRLHESGLPVRTISSKCGVSKTTVQRWITTSSPSSMIYPVPPAPLIVNHLQNDSPPYDLAPKIVTKEETRL